MARAEDTDTRDKLLDASFHVFGEMGFQAATIKEIADRAGVAGGSVYTYFKDKEDLFRATVQRGWDRFLGEMEQLSALPGSREERLSRLVSTEFVFGTLEKGLPLLRGMLFDSSRLNMLSRNIERLCAIIERFVLTQPDGAEQDIPLGLRGPQSLHSFVRVVVLGILANAAMWRPERYKNEIESLKVTIAELLGVDMNRGRGATEA